MAMGMTAYAATDTQRADETKRRIEQQINKINEIDTAPVIGYKLAGGESLGIDTYTTIPTLYLDTDT